MESNMDLFMRARPQVYVDNIPDEAVNQMASLVYMLIAGDAKTLRTYGKNMNGETTTYCKTGGVHSPFHAKNATITCETVNTVNCCGDSPLLLAVYYDFYKDFRSSNERFRYVQKLTKLGANLNFVAKDNTTPLSAAIEFEHVRVLQLLIRSGATIPPNSLVTAAKTGSSACVYVLLNENPAVAQAEKDSALHYAAKMGSFECVVMLSIAGAKADHINDNGYSVLHFAAEGGNVHCVGFLLLVACHNVNHQTYDSESTPLHEAAAYEQPKCVERLLDAGADINIRNEYNATALDVAMEKVNTCEYDDAERENVNEYKQCVNFLKSATEKQLAKFNSVNEKGRTALCEEIINGNKDRAIWLINEGVDIDIVDERFGMTSLMWAVYKLPSIVSYIDLGNTDVNKRCSETGVTALHLAAYKGRTGCIHRLIAVGARVNKKDKYGSTALHLAAYNGHENCVTLLLNRNADINAINKSKSTPLMWAWKNGHWRCAKLLKNARKEQLRLRKIMRAAASIEHYDSFDSDGKLVFK
jgi:ankyrin repeat protein